MALARVRGAGHPDVACDLVAASVVEEYLRRDPASRLNIRVSGGQGVMFLVGEIRSSADFDVSSIVRRTLGQCGVGANTEPFIAFETMAPAWAPPFGAREVTSVLGYATEETPDRFPRCVSFARDIAREFERRRLSDADWFWVGSDYELIVDDQGTRPLIVLRVEHVETYDLARVRQDLEAFVRSRRSEAEIRINPAGEETRAGLATRMGSSGRTCSMDQYGSQLPASASGIGYHLTHPANAGAWMARAAARELVAQGKGKAVMVNLAWLPAEARPHLIRFRNERGEDLSAFVDPQRFDLAQIPESFLSPSLAMASARTAFDGSIILPWEARVG